MDCHRDGDITARLASQPYAVGFSGSSFGNVECGWRDEETWVRLEASNVDANRVGHGAIASIARVRGRQGVGRASIGAHLGVSGLVINRHRADSLVNGDSGGVGRGPFQSGIFTFIDGRRRRGETVHVRPVPNADRDGGGGCIGAGIGRIRGRQPVARFPGGFGTRRLRRSYTSTSSGTVKRNCPNSLVDGGSGSVAGSPDQPGGLLLSESGGVGAETTHARRSPNGNGDAAGAGIATTRGGKPVGCRFGGFGRARLRRSDGLASVRAVKRNRPNSLVDGDAVGVGAVPTQG